MADEESQSARALNLQRWKSVFVCFGLIFFFFFFVLCQFPCPFIFPGRVIVYSESLLSHKVCSKEVDYEKSLLFSSPFTPLRKSKKKWKKEEIVISEPHGALGMSHLSFSQSCERHANIFSFFNARRTLPKSRDSL